MKEVRTISDMDAGHLVTQGDRPELWVNLLTLRHRLRTTWVETAAAWDLDGIRYLALQNHALGASFGIPDENPLATHGARVSECHTAAENVSRVHIHIRCIEIVMSTPPLTP
ncbi:MAG: hypothetical protein AMJ88_16045 [Anaerolineae bacterium SM23_ 63]|nr:MAG: hypothetical protein AMJ88_16045 [Anaerolineae bacterium SM23_ 63]